MKNTTLLILLSLFITSCGDNIREEITERYDDGKIKTIMKFIGENSEEVMIGKLVYSQSGDTLVWENYNSKGEKDGHWIGYIHAPINRLVKRNFKDGKEDGKWTSFYKNGQIDTETNYKDGELDGKWIHYNENDGHLVSLQNYRDGKKHGKTTSYYQNGQIKEEQNYKDDKWDGKWTQYDKNGKITFEGNYKNGKKINSKYY